MPTVADLRQMAQELGRIAQATRTDGHLRYLQERSVQHYVPGHVRWAASQLDVWSEEDFRWTPEGQIARAPTTQVAAAFPACVEKHLQAAAARRVDDVAAVLAKAPRRPRTSEEYRQAAAASETAQRGLDEAALLESVAVACKEGAAHLHLSSRSMGWQAPAAMCITTSTKLHVCVQPRHSSRGFRGARGVYHGPATDDLRTWCPTSAVVLHAPFCRVDRHEEGHRCSEVHPLIADVISQMTEAFHLRLLAPGRSAKGEAEQRLSGQSESRDEVGSSPTRTPEGPRSSVTPHNEEASGPSVRFEARSKTPSAPEDFEREVRVDHGYGTPRGTHVKVPGGEVEVGPPERVQRHIYFLVCEDRKEVLFLGQADDWVDYLYPPDHGAVTAFTGFAPKVYVTAKDIRAAGQQWLADTKAEYLPHRPDMVEYCEDIVNNTFVATALRWVEARGGRCRVCNTYDHHHRSDDVPEHFPWEKPGCRWDGDPADLQPGWKGDDVLDLMDAQRGRKS